MKKGCFFLMIFLCIFILKSGQATALTQQLKGNGADQMASNEPILFPPTAKITEKGVTYIPIWLLISSLKLEMVSDPVSGTIMIKKDTKWIRFFIKKQTSDTSHGTHSSLGIINKRNNLYLPLEFVSAYFGYEAELSTVEKLISPEQKISTAASSVIEARNEQPSDDTLIKEKLFFEQQSIEKPKAEQPIIGKPKVYLTFDDGPNEHLNEILDILKAKNAKGTFFMIEPQIRPNQDAVKRLVAEGHYPALHSVSHDKNKLYGGDPLNVVNEMEQTRKTLLEVTGVDSKLARAPYGSKPFMTEPFRKALADDGMKMWDWNVDSMDWKFQRTNPPKILENIQTGLETVKNKQGPIVILMHVTKGTATELPQVIDYLYSKGYECPAYNPQKHVTVNFWNDPRL